MLTEMRIKQFRSCHDTNIRFDQGLTALVGKNGAGKTNLLHAILQLSEFTRNHAPIGLGNYHCTFLFNIECMHYTYEIEFSDIELFNSYKERLFLEKTDDLNYKVFSRTDGIISLGPSIENKVLHLNSVDSIAVEVGVPTLSALMSLLPAVNSTRLAIEPLFRFLRSIGYYPDPGLDQSKSPYVFQREYEFWLRRSSDSAWLDGDSSASESLAIRMKLIYWYNENKEILDYFRFLMGPNGLNLLDTVEITSYETAVEMYKISFIPSAQLAGAGRTEVFADLSVGTRRVIQLVVSLLHDKRSIFLLEEPEDSIHPGLLEKLVGILRSFSETTQIIVASHSSDLLNELEPEEIRLVHAEGGVTKVEGFNSAEVEEVGHYLKEVGPLSEYIHIFCED